MYSCCFEISLEDTSANRYFCEFLALSDFGVNTLSLDVFLSCWKNIPTFFDNGRFVPKQSSLPQFISRLLLYVAAFTSNVPFVNMFIIFLIVSSWSHMLCIFRSYIFPVTFVFIFSVLFFYYFRNFFWLTLLFVLSCSNFVRLWFQIFPFFRHDFWKYPIYFVLVCLILPLNWI
jgi:hypothetical protein